MQLVRMMPSPQTFKQYRILQLIHDDTGECHGGHFKLVWHCCSGVPRIF